MAAVWASLGPLAALILPAAHTERMSLFVQYGADALRADFVVWRVDRAGGHRAKALAIPDTIRLWPQPAHRPELNPTEHLWEDIREKDLPNRVFKDSDEWVDRLWGDGIDERPIRSDGGR